jgi:urocanate hydratase
MADNHIDFKYSSYVQDIMGPMCFDGFGPFRWVCASGKPEDLQKQIPSPAKC